MTNAWYLLWTFNWSFWQSGSVLEFEGTQSVNLSNLRHFTLYLSLLVPLSVAFSSISASYFKMSRREGLLRNLGHFLSLTMLTYPDWVNQQVLGMYVGT
jgi:hypothetical protein